MADKRKPTVFGVVKDVELHEGAIDLGAATTGRGFKEGDKVRSGDREFIVARQDDGTLIFVDVKSLN